MQKNQKIKTVEKLAKVDFTPLQKNKRVDEAGYFFHLLCIYAVDRYASIFLFHASLRPLLNAIFLKVGPMLNWKVKMRTESALFPVLMKHR